MVQPICEDNRQWRLPPHIGWDWASLSTSLHCGPMAPSTTPEHMEAHTPSSRQRLRSCRPVALAVVVAAAAAELDHGLSSAWSGASSGDSTHTRGETGQAGFECSGTPFDEQFTTCSGRPGAARGCRRAATIAAGDRNRSSAAIGRQPPDLCTASCWAERHVHPPQQRSNRQEVALRTAGTCWCTPRPHIFQLQACHTPPRSDSYLCRRVCLCARSTTNV